MFYRYSNYGKGRVKRSEEPSQLWSHTLAIPEIRHMFNDVIIDDKKDEKNWVKNDVSLFWLTQLVSHRTRVSDEKSLTVESWSISCLMKSSFPKSPHFGFEWFYSIFNVYKSWLINFRLQRANPDKVLTLGLNFSNANACKSADWAHFPRRLWIKFIIH